MKNLEALRRLLPPDVFAALEAPLGELSDVQLGELEAEIVSTVERHLEGDPTDAALVEAESIVAALEVVRGERTNRATRPTRVAAVRDKLKPADLRRPSRFAPRVRPGSSMPRVVTASGQPISGGLAGVAEALEQQWRATAADRPRGRTRYNVARVEADFPAERLLGLDPNENAFKIEAVVSPSAIVAAGGLCAPVDVKYDMLVSSTEERPVRAALARFGANHGGVRLIPPPTMADVAAAVGVVTEEQDAANATKGCLTVSCAAEEETRVEAIYRCLQIGNFGGQFFPEQTRGWLTKAMAQHAREAEDRLLDAIGAGSTNVTTGKDLGAARDLLAAVDQASAAYRWRGRLGDERRLRAIFPAWARNIMRADLARAMPGDDLLRITDQMIDDWFAVRSINVAWHFDGAGGGPLGWDAQTAGPLVNFPNAVVWYLFTEGGWLFLDGGVLDVGIVRDSALNAANNFRIFAESFEAAAFVGDAGSLEVTSTVCATGEAAELVMTGCATGS